MVGHDSVPNPGSDEARLLKCLCPVIDNHFGRGCGKDKDGSPLFWFEGNCPVHATVTIVATPVADPDARRI